mmetsp:Transcript_7877/g.14287  ORF Transcript_7877/g.14287 Transcript_7877/m.14287 type:complete len:389 (-) Transcript_7877:364-1530(-)|eukprot:CAMPEP_0182450546 /NCGR_PEP_ID=MMETSP1172-20130603/41999_1 /TAXON_ID=708627 /ORGANISM="Timspurckia oligopyrenoides, Strain CCMP3278" /LENGTH=388 /DNA_ID=CAMNT_0024648187 /DNA_START=89 /DNA_END=1255 /DNA_ORIENTATION=+
MLRVAGGDDPRSPRSPRSPGSPASPSSPRPPAPDGAVSPSRNAQSSTATAAASASLKYFDCGGDTQSIGIPAGVLYTFEPDMLSTNAWAEDLIGFPNATVRYELRDMLFLTWMLTQRGSYLTEVDLRELSSWLNEFSGMMKIYFQVHLKHVMDAAASKIPDESLPPALRSNTRKERQITVNRTMAALLGMQTKVATNVLPADHAVLQMRGLSLQLCAVMCELFEAQKRVLVPSLGAVMTREDGFTINRKVADEVLSDGNANGLAMFLRAQWATDDIALAFWRKKVMRGKYGRAFDRAIFWLQRSHIGRVEAVSRRIRLFLNADVRMPQDMKTEVRDKAARVAERSRAESAALVTKKGSLSSPRGGLLKTFSSRGRKSAELPIEDYDFQ